jgi:hypothetical protein
MELHESFIVVAPDRSKEKFDAGPDFDASL